MIAVMGATGNTGSKIVKLLLDAGEEVRALGRSASRLAELEAAGAQALAGDATDTAYLTDAFRGADSVYTLLPFDPTSPGYLEAQERLGEAIVRAVRDAGVRYVVALSSVGADRPAGTGVLVSLHRQEQRLRTLEQANVLLLRAGAFFETFHAALEVIEHEGVNADSVAPDAPIPMIATRDVAAVAAEALRARDWSGVVVRELLGERDLSYAEVTRILGAAIGRPDLAYVQLPEAEMVAALTQAGLARDFAELLVEFHRALGDTIASREGRKPENTTPTRFEDFAASDLAGAFPAA